MDRYSQRRTQFMNAIGGGLAIIPAAAETVRNDDVQHVFRQSSDFFFLTGFEEPDAVALLDPGHDEPYVLFVRPSDPEMEVWYGKRVGVDGATARFGANAAYPIADLDKVLRDRFRDRDALWYATDSSTDSRVLGALRQARGMQIRTGVMVPASIVDPSTVLAELRLIKTPEEIEALREACRISADGHTEAIRFAAPGRTEHEVQSAMEYVFRASGAVREGYPSIVASGDNACILHYVENDQPLHDGDLLLIDAAAEIGYLSSDITRTFPVNGRFSDAQRAVYNVVLAAQEAVIDACTPGLPFTDMHDIAVQPLTEGMVDLGLLPGPVEDAVAYGWYREFYFHGTGHWLGLDVHDAGVYRIDGTGRPLQPGMTFTVEPGIYIARDKTVLDLARVPFDVDAERDLAYLEGASEAKRILDERKSEADVVTHEIPERFLGIGVRIEDDLLVTSSGCENLTRGVPVDPDEIEALWAEAPTVPVIR
ncbi:MAG: aminopeptidase P N-terminal domain-containing protein [Actinomycetota bacterium]|nr:aminopeptidase P N-terminal domain-containing protein [Actinomycetota bacterium]